MIDESKKGLCKLCGDMLDIDLDRTESCKKCGYVKLKTYTVTIPVTSEVTATVEAENSIEAWEKATEKAIEETPLVTWMVDEDAIKEDCVSEEEEPKVHGALKKVGL